MIETINAIVGSGVVVVNLIPFIIRKCRYLLLTSLVSILMLFVLNAFR